MAGKIEPADGGRRREGRSGAVVVGRFFTVKNGELMRGIRWFNWASNRTK
jgi:hypothetical protein